ncbi:unnamed protein product [Protopolystoma xenopodis]|uniref:Cyclic nucleotide-binding domain-containing protein n=1 Tax=Protopolystoma xenopodis TaxID=117903 RepID=A0A3S4ZXI2_9PLAT|nr:unnamed protein product [Protopolystoma xenopodis]
MMRPKVISNFPECLQADICLHMNRKLLKGCKAFRGASAGCLRAFSLKFRTLHVPAGDTLVHPGDMLNSIYFISRGTIEITLIDGKGVRRHGPLVMAVLGKYTSSMRLETFCPIPRKDDIFGDSPDSALAGNVNQSLYAVRAQTYVTLKKIDLMDMRSILQMYPEWSDRFLQNFNLTFNLCDRRKTGKQEQNGWMYLDTFTITWQQLRVAAYPVLRVPDGELQEDSSENQFQMRSFCMIYRIITKVSHEFVHYLRSD